MPHRFRLAWREKQRNKGIPLQLFSRLSISRSSCKDDGYIFIMASTEELEELENSVELVRSASYIKKLPDEEVIYISQVIIVIIVEISQKVWIPDALGYMCISRVEFPGRFVKASRCEYSHCSAQRLFFGI